MREHKYRAWDTVKKVMYSAKELGADQETLSPDGRGFINVSGISTRLSQYHTHLLPLEFTGLLDKNGKEIYEGDIVKFILNSEQVISEVWYCVNHFRYETEDLDLGEIDNEDRIEVIGNIYENPELLEK